MHSGVVLMFPRRQSFAGRVKANAIEVFEQFKEFEQNHARLAWGITLAGFVIGVALQAL